MSEAGLQAKKKWNEDYFKLHPDSRTIEVVENGLPIAEFPALFDSAYFSNNRDNGNVEQQKRSPHITFFSAWASLLIARKTKLRIGAKDFTVYIVKTDDTEETFQAEAWLV